MRPKIRDKERLLALPWPDDVPVLVEDDLCPHTEPKPHRKPVWDWIKAAFPEDLEQYEELRDQFAHVFQWVMKKSVDQADKAIICPSDVPSPQQRITKAPYSAAEVAAWWKEALEVVGYDLGND